MHYESGGYYNDENLVVPEFVSARLDQIISSFAAYRSVNKLLDIGCGAGSLLFAAKRAAWDAEGVELSLPTAQHLKNRGLKVFAGELAAAAFPPACFDVVTAAELIEHVADPASLVAEVARILRPGGLFWATTPHSNGASGRVLKVNWSIISPPEHLHLFSASGLTTLLSQHGFRKIRVKTEGLSFSELAGAFRREQHTAGTTSNAAHARVSSDYQFNEKLLKNPRGRMLKNSANALLRASRLGDFLKVHAER
ncbi:MAG TPA: class I SAM-dependent methyltransferase [Pyrinomonadaceae bacterium]